MAQPAQEHAPPHIQVRSLRMEDTAAVQAIFTEGMMSLAPYAWRQMVLARRIHILGPSAAVAALASLIRRPSRSSPACVAMLSFVVASAAQVAYYWWVVHSEVSKHAGRMLQGDMADPWNHYMFDDMKHFWVATKTDASGIEKVVGCAGIDVAARKSENKQEPTVQEQKDKAKAALTKEGGDVSKFGELRRMAVSKDIRQCGVASKLYKAVENQAHKTQLEGLYLETSSMQPAACAMYTKLGFRLLTEMPIPVYPWKYFAKVRYYEKKF